MTKIELLDTSGKQVSVTWEEAYLAIVGSTTFKLFGIDKASLLAFRRLYIIRGGKEPITPESINSIFNG